MHVCGLQGCNNGRERHMMLTRMGRMCVVISKNITQPQALKEPQCIYKCSVPIFPHLCPLAVVALRIHPCHCSCCLLLVILPVGGSHVLLGLVGAW